MLVFLHKKKLGHNKVIPFFSMVEKRKRMHLDIMDLMNDTYKNILKTSIPYSSIVEKMGIYREPVVKYRPSSPASLAYIELWNEIENRIRKKK